MKKTKVKKFSVDMYDWDVTLIEATGAKDWEVVKAELRKIKFDHDEMYDIKQKLSFTDGGDHCFNYDKKASVIIIYSPTSTKSRINCICHEKRHLEDRILAKSHIDNLEAAAYLAGFLAEKLLL